MNLRIKTTMIATLFAALPLAAWSNSPRIVENPLIETANTMGLDIIRVELTDTATILNVNAYNTPGYWIRIDSKSYLQSEGKKYALTKADGITPDSLFWMPESGKASFRLMFQPLPLRARSFDFIESDCETCWKLFGIDLTGKTAYDAPEGIPAEARQADGNAPLPAPLFKYGETTLDVQLLYYRPELGKELTLYVNTLAGKQEEYTAPIDPATGKASFRFKQYGTAQAFCVTQQGWSNGTLWLAPGEHTVIYYDMRRSGQFILAQRDEKKAPDLQGCYSTGTYANLNNLLAGLQAPTRVMQIHSGRFADYKMSAKEYVKYVADNYKALSDSIDSDSLPPLTKEWAQLSLKVNAVNAILGGDRIRELNYRSRNKDWDFTHPVEGIDPMTPQDKATVCQWFDINDPMLLMGLETIDYIGNILKNNGNWQEAAGIRTGLVPALYKYGRLAATKAANGTLTEEDLKVFTADDNPFFADALRDMQADALAKLKAMEGEATVEPTPDVPLAQLFDAIIAPYKGKVVFVDFWNTWCGPCRASIKQTEPKKSNELNNPDLVWIYIANETSPAVQYKTMIPNIKGKHFRLNQEQWNYLCEKFQIDGIPSYVVVDRDGTYRLRNDLRNHSLMVKTLKEKLDAE